MEQTQFVAVDFQKAVQHRFSSPSVVSSTRLLCPCREASNSCKPASHSLHFRDAVLTHGVPTYVRGPPFFRSTPVGSCLSGSTMSSRASDSLTTPRSPRNSALMCQASVGRGVVRTFHRFQHETSIFFNIYLISHMLQ